MKFDDAKTMIHVHDELLQMLNNLQDNNTSIGSIKSCWDGPGINYVTYSENIKLMLIEDIKEHLSKIEENFN